MNSDTGIGGFDADEIAFFRDSTAGTFIANMAEHLETLAERWDDWRIEKDEASKMSMLDELDELATNAGAMSDFLSNAKQREINEDLWTDRLSNDGAACSRD